MSAVLDDVIKSVKDATDAIKAAQSDNKESVQKMVEQTIKNVLQNHPGFTPQRKIQFEGQLPNEKDDLLAQCPKEIQEGMDRVYLLSKMLNVHPKQLKSWDPFKRMFDAKAGEFRKALDSTTAGGVDEWVPTEMSPSLIEKVRLQLKVAALFPSIQMPTNPYVLPVEIGDIVSYKQAENTADTGQTIIPVGDSAGISGNVTFTAVGHATRVLMSKEATEDSIVPLLPLIQNRIVLALVQGREDAILNGDTAGSHEDTDISASDSRKKLWLGLRAHANNQTYQTDLATLTFANLLTQRGSMGVYGVNPADLAIICSINGWIKLMQGLGNEVTTLEKFGPNATILSGQLAAVGGVPIIVSEYIRNDLNASGIYESGATKTAIYTVNRNGFAMGERSRPTSQLLQELYAVYGQNALISTERVDFEPLYPIATNRVIDLGVNVG